MLASPAWRGPASRSSSNDGASVICWAPPWSHLPSCSRQHPARGVIKPVWQMRRPRQKGKELARGHTVSQGVALGVSDSAALLVSLTGLRGQNVRPSWAHRLCHGPELPRQILLWGRCHQPRGGREGHPPQSCGWKRGAGVSPEPKLPGGEPSRLQGLWLAGARGAGSEGLEKPCFSLAKVHSPSLCSLGGLLCLAGRAVAHRRRWGQQPQMHLLRGPRGPWLCGAPASPRSQRRLSSAGLLLRASCTLPHSDLRQELLAVSCGGEQSCRTRLPSRRGEGPAGPGSFSFLSEPSLLRGGDPQRGQVSPWSPGA